MDIINKIKISRKILKEILNNDYDTDKLPIYNNTEINNLFSLKSTKDNPYNNMGDGYACNFTLNHKILKDHHIHILYYNFQKNNIIKVTKTIIDKILNLYDNTFKSTDNVIIIINESIKDNIKTLNNSLNLLLKEKNYNIIKNNIGLEKKHFRNVFIFDINTLQYNILNHKLVPEHKLIRNKEEIKTILEKCNCNIDQLPIISKNDAIAKLKLCIDGDICKITRTSKTSGEYYYYRICR